ncbi:lysophospholipid acyltransferase 7-like [Plodia interpunctella]|uniref:lysophospholipid acyltransferase 7-like n=1 Tax=Plodia interpunctella TaxID=58824 RepID=UPI002367AFCD|nr:lysophospholipid acyltransferase 7-like [Plodia interpunctella]
MEIGLNEIIYYFSLLICMSLGSYYRKIDDIETKRNYGAGLGILTACLICGFQIYHCVLMVWGNVVIIKCSDKRYVHHLSMAYTWTYLIYMYYYAATSQYVIWLHQAMALKLVGLAFEINNHDKRTNPNRPPMPNNTMTSGDNQVMTTEPTAVDIITYSFFFIGIHKGPYYRWKTFESHFSEPFATLGDCRVITMQKLKKVALCSMGFLLLSTRYSAKYYNADSFYRDHNTDYRFLYNIPLLVMFFLQNQMVMALSTAVCTEAGFGVYPAKCNPLPGHGPSEHTSFMNVVTAETALAEEYNFGMLKCFENGKLLLGPKMKDTLRSWDMPTVYWFWINIYKNMSKTNKETRSACSYLAWTLWCGADLQHFILAATLWVYVNLELEFSGIFNTARQMKRLPWEIGFSLMRILCLIYLTPCVIIKDTSVFLRYYNSIYWIYHWFLLGSIIVAIALQKLLN